jgi:hypothetical protein
VNKRAERNPSLRQAFCYPNRLCILAHGAKSMDLTIILAKRRDGWALDQLRRRVTHRLGRVGLSLEERSSLARDLAINTERKESFNVRD